MEREKYDGWSVDVAQITSTSDNGNDLEADVRRFFAVMNLSVIKRLTHENYTAMCPLHWNNSQKGLTDDGDRRKVNLFFEGTRSSKLGSNDFGEKFTEESKPVLPLSSPLLAMVKRYNFNDLRTTEEIAGIFWTAAGRWRELGTFLQDLRTNTQGSRAIHPDDFEGQVKEVFEILDFERQPWLSGGSVFPGIARYYSTFPEYENLFLAEQLPYILGGTGVVLLLFV